MPTTEKKGCFHECTGNCRREGCNCLCGEFHCVPSEPCRDPQEECPNHQIPRQEGLEKQVADILFKHHYPNMEEFLPRDSQAIKEIAELIASSEQEGRDMAVDSILAKFPEDTSPDSWRAFTQVMNPNKIVEAARNLPTKLK